MFSRVRIFIVVFFCFCFAHLSAQLSGNYTIDQNDTISPTNFSSIVSFLDSIHQNGISGNVTVNIDSGSGPYIGRITLDSVQGLTSTSKLVINGNNELIYDTATSFRQPIVHLKNMKYTTITNLKVKAGNNGFYSDGIVVENNSSLNIISNCEIQAGLHLNPSNFGVRLGSYKTIWTSNATSDNNRIINNHISGGKFGIRIYGDTNQSLAKGNHLEGNKIFDAAQMGLSLRQSKRDSIIKNEIVRTQNRSDTTSLWAISCVGSGEFVIASNKIKMAQVALNQTNYIGIDIYNGTNTASNPARIFNNLIYGYENVKQTFGIKMSNSSYMEFHYNTIFMKNSTDNFTGRGIAYDDSYGSSSHVHVTNNILSFHRNSHFLSSARAHIVDDTLLKFIDYNVIYFKRKSVPPYDYYANYLGWKFETLKDWQSYQNGRFAQNSDSSNPEFLFYPVDSLIPNSEFIDGIADPISWITTDYYGNLRSSTNPDPGAIEFTAITHDVGIVQGKIHAHCGVYTKLPIKVYNNGTDTLTSFLIYYQQDSSSVDSSLIQCYLGKRDSLTIYIDSVYNLFDSRFKIWVTKPNDTIDFFPLNDTIYQGIHTGISGYFTINSAKITDDSVNFQSFEDMAYALNNYGVCGPVEIRVVPRSGPYEESLTIGQIRGSSSINNVIIKGSLDTLKYVPGMTSNLTLFHLKGADHVTIDSLVFYNPGGEASTLLNISHDANFNTLSNSLLKMEYYNGLSWNKPYYGVTMFSDTVNFSGKNEILKNEIMGGTIAVFIGGNSLLGVDSTLVDSNFVHYFSYKGIVLSSTRKAQVTNNIITQDSVPIYNFFTGIQLYNNTQSQVLNNLINAPKDGGSVEAIGISVNGNNGTTGSETIIANNIINDIQSNAFSGSKNGFEIVNSHYVNLVHNTIRLYNVYGNGSRFTIGINTGFKSSNIKIVNNLIALHNTNGSTTYFLDYADSGSTYLSDHNVFYEINDDPSTTYFGRYQTTYYDSLNQWQSIQGLGFDSNSVVAYPMFENDSLTPRSALIDNMGIPVGISSDYFGRPRNSVRPDPGAIEFESDTIDVAVDSIPYNLFGLCADSNQLLRAYVKNYGRHDLFNIPIIIRLQDSVSVRTYQSFVDTLLFWETKLVTIDTVDLSNDRILDLMAYSSMPGDQFPKNDTAIGKSPYLWHFPSAPLILDTLVCKGSQVVFGPYNNFKSIWWFKNSQTLNPWKIGDSLVLNNVVNSRTYYAEGEPENIDCRGKRTSFYLQIKPFSVDFTFLMQTGNTYKFNAQLTGKIDSLLWDFGDGNISIDTNPTHSFSSNGSYKVTLNIFGDCGSEFLTKTLGVTTVGISSNKIPDIAVHIYPNPTRGVVNVEIKGESDRQYLTEIFDFYGKVIYSSIDKYTRTKVNTIELSDVSKGAYLLKVSDNETMWIFKLIVN